MPKKVVTLVLDKQKFPRDKTCGGGLPIRLLQRFLYVVNDTIIEAHTTSGTVFSPSLQHQIEISNETPNIATTLRKKFDFELVKFAQDAGAMFQDGCPVLAVHLSNDVAQVTPEQGTTIGSEIIVGADGVISMIAKHFGFRRAGTKRRICILQEFEVDEQIMDQYFKKSRHYNIHSRFKTIAGYG